MKWGAISKLFGTILGWIPRACSVVSFPQGHGLVPWRSVAAKNETLGEFGMWKWNSFQGFPYGQENMGGIHMKLCEIC